MPFDRQQKTSCAHAAVRAASHLLRLTKILAGCLLLVLHLGPGQVFGAAQPATYSLTLSWDPSPSPEVVGYRLYYGVVSGAYTTSLVAGNVATFPVSGLLAGVTYYFALTAIDAEGLESGYSNEVSYSEGLPCATMQIRVAGGGQFLLTVTGLSGHSYDIEATQDFAVWNVIGTLTLDASGSADFTDPNAANFPQRFYRTRDTQP